MKKKNAKRARSLSSSPKKEKENKTPRSDTSNPSTSKTDPINSKMEDTAPMEEAVPPPPIKIKKLINYIEKCKKLEELIGKKTFTCRSTVNETIFNFTTSDGYRKAVRFFRESNEDFHTYQLDEDKCFRVVIRHLHHSTPVDMIKNELEELGYNVKNVTNVILKRKEDSSSEYSRTPLPLFFIDLEKRDNIQDIFHLKYLAYCNIKIEEPYKRREIVQCQRCQQYGHTKSYCNHAPKCIRCAGSHLTTACITSRQEPVVCALCGGNHPANYKGCDIYKTLQKRLRRPEAVKNTAGIVVTPPTQPTTRGVPATTTTAPTTMDGTTPMTTPPMKVTQSGSNKRHPPARKETTSLPPRVTSLDDFPPLGEIVPQEEMRSSYAGAVSPPRPRSPPLPAYIPPPHPAHDMTPLLNRVLSELSELTNLIKPLIATLTTVMTNLLPFLTKCALSP